MSRQATVYEVLIASPGDVEVERKIIQEVVYEWNAAHSRATGAVLLPIMRETHSVPSLRDRAQGVINEDLVRDCDMLIGAFWTRLGTNTGVAVSGTAEEIDQMDSAGKPIILYFSKAPISPDSINFQQYEALKAYKDKLKPRGLLGEYDSIENLRSQLQRQLATQMHKLHQGVMLSSISDMFDPSLPSVEDISERLGEEARILLLETTKDPHGQILVMSVFGGKITSTNGKSFGERGNRRVNARWDAAIKDLLRYELIEERGFEGKAYDITDLGYKVADYLEKPQKTF